VIHPAIDGALQLRKAHQLTAAQIERIDLKVHRLVLELTGKKDPRTGLESKFSVYHAVAAAIARGTVGEKEFGDAVAKDPEIVALRSRVTAEVTPAVAEDQVHVFITLKDGRLLEKQIDHAIGSAKNPMTDAQLEAKFATLTEGVLPPRRVRRLIDLCWNIATLPKASDLARAAAG
jgi:2-methylcitrate dehydratase PrpD